MDVSSTGIRPGESIDPRFVETRAGGDNTSPDISWSGAPPGTRSYAVTCFDPDAPTGAGWWHWVVTDIPATITSLGEGAELPQGARAWVNDSSYRGWSGPCPPPGPAHRYQFKVHAVAVERLDVPDDASGAVARTELARQRLDSAELTAVFANPAS